MVRSLSQARKCGWNAISRCVAVIDFSPDPDVAEAAHRVVRSVRPALIFLHHRDAIGILAVGAQARRVVDRKFEVIAQFGTRKALR